ncbi:MAG: hypothetical protein ACYTEX_27760 [Planctomycetota bacterium]|jgi:hypothetical protein
MCLDVDLKATKTYRRKIKGKPHVLVYKILRYGANGELCSRYYCTYWKPGVKRSNRRSAVLGPRETKDGFVGRGIHVFRTRHAAHRKCLSAYLVVSLRARPESLVACGTNGEAVFHEVELTQTTYSRAMKH